MVRFTLVGSSHSRGENTWHHGQTTWCPFCVYSVSATCHSWSLGASFVVFNIMEFSLNWFSTLIAFGQQKSEMQSQTRGIFFWPKTNYSIPKHVYMINFFLDCSRSLVYCFDSGPWVASVIRMRHDMLLLHNWNDNYLFCSQTKLWLITLPLGC